MSKMMRTHAEASYLPEIVIIFEFCDGVSFKIEIFKADTTFQVGHFTNLIST